MPLNNNTPSYSHPRNSNIIFNFILHLLTTTSSSILSKSQNLSRK
ncbi:hypothetical protein Lalb_Chr15g0088951 [Lupinus albus]|uniref:Uncharacterized protein n=1 Tax=Lupinus albus TaxID=3870 RepID=A0A6A4P061_LUPAL|nr:hypothetical protein Lalb_Chr15g0088951 [Lupinus albus]